MEQAKMADEQPPKALLLTEILEQVLLQLDMRDVLRCQAVSKHWQHLIGTSPALQQHLFLKPAPFRDSEAPRINPLLAALFPRLFDFEVPGSRYSWESSHYMRSMHWYQDETTRRKILQTDASWRHMYPVQPPAKLGSLEVRSQDTCLQMDFGPYYGRLAEAYQHIQKPGLTMGSLFDILICLHNLHAWPSFFVHWRMFPLQRGTPDPPESASDSGMGVEDLFNLDDVLDHSITLYHLHWSLCDGYPDPKQEISLYRPFFARLGEDDSPGLIEFPDDLNEESPAGAYSNWSKVT
jgi:hypothetical protein